MIGPTSSGKTTIANIIAKELGFVHIQTGAMFRCIALKILEEKVDLNNLQEIERILKNTKMKFKNTEDGQAVILNGEDVTKKIREEKVTNLTSNVASILQVRNYLLNIQREMGNKENVVIEGRDTATRVFPNADVKFFLNADPKVRAKRKYEELKKNGENVVFIEVLKNLYDWDYEAINRKEGALKKAHDSIYIDTSNISVSELKNQMISTIEKIYQEKYRKSNDEKSGEINER